MKYIFKDCVNVQLGDMVEFCDVKIEVTEKLIKNNPRLFKIIDEYIPEYYKCLEEVSPYDGYFSVGKIYENYNPNPNYIGLIDGKNDIVFNQKIIFDYFYALTKQEAKEYKYYLKCEDFLKQAYEKFPIGCKVNNLNLSSYNYNFTILKQDFNILKISDNNIRIFTGVGDVADGIFCIFNELGWAEVKSLPLFKTEDDVFIYQNDKIIVVDLEDHYIYLRRASKPSRYDFFLNSKYKIFSTEELAKKYVEKNKKNLKHYEDLLLKSTDIVFGNNNSLIGGSYYNVMKENDSKLYWLKVLQLIANDLNVDWQTSDTCEKFMIGRRAHNNWEIVSIKHIYVTYSDIYFKSEDIANKAIEIMDDKLNEILK